MKKYAILLSFLLPFASVAERAMPIQDGKLTTPLNANGQSITNLPLLKFQNGAEFDGTPASVGGVSTNEYTQGTNKLWQALVPITASIETNKNNIASVSNGVESAFAQIETNRQHIALASNAVVAVEGRTTEIEGGTNRWNSAYAQSQTNKTHITSLSNSVSSVIAKTNDYDTVTKYAVRSNNSGRISIGMGDNPANVLNVNGNIYSTGNISSDYTVSANYVSSGSLSAGTLTLAQTASITLGFTLGSWLFSNKDIGTEAYAPVKFLEDVSSVTVASADAWMAPSYDTYVSTGESGFADTTDPSGTFIDTSFNITVIGVSESYPFSNYEQLTRYGTTIYVGDSSSTLFGLNISWSMTDPQSGWTTLPTAYILVEITDGVSWYYYTLPYNATSLVISDFSGASSWPLSNYKSAPAISDYDLPSQGYGVWYGQYYEIYAHRSVIIDGNYYEILQQTPCYASSSGSGYTKTFLSWTAVPDADDYIVYNTSSGYYRSVSQSESPNCWDYGDYNNWYGFEGNVQWTSTGNQSLFSLGYTPAPLADYAPAFTVYDKDMNKRVQVDKNGLMAFTPAGGTPPFSTDSASKIDNLNSDFLDGLHADAFQLAGNYTTPSTVTQIVGSVAVTNIAVATNAMFETVMAKNGGNVTIIPPDGRANLLSATNSTVSAYIQSNGDVRVTGKYINAPFSNISTSSVAIKNSAMLIYYDGTNGMASAKTFATSGSFLYSTNNWQTFGTSTVSSVIVKDATFWNGLYYFVSSSTTVPGIYSSSSMTGGWSRVYTTTFTLNSTYGVFATTPSTILAGDGVGLYRSTNGVSWATVLSGICTDIKNLGGTKWIATFANVGQSIVISEDDGVTWRVPSWATSAMTGQNLWNVAVNSSRIFIKDSSTTFFIVDRKTLSISINGNTGAFSSTPFQLSEMYCDDTGLVMWTQPFESLGVKTQVSVDNGATFYKPNGFTNIYGRVYQVNNGLSLKCFGQASSSGIEILTIPFFTSVDYTCVRNPMVPRWQDTFVSGIALRSGGTSPTREEVTPNSGIYGTGFAINENSDYAGQVQHGVASTNANFPNFYYNPHIHVSVSAITAPNTNATFVLTWQIAPVNSNYLGTSISKTTTVSWAVSETNIAKIVSFGMITNNLLQGADSLIFRGDIKRITTPTIGNDVSAKVIVDSLDFHFPYDSVGSSAIFGDAP